MAKPLTVLHFADAHIDMANYGRHDPQTGLPMRVMDFLKSLDTIVETAISEKVDLVLFAGDAYKDRNPAPTFQREWGKRIMRLAHAGIPTLLLVGNHDLSPAAYRAHALDAFHTLEVALNAATLRSAGGAWNIFAHLLTSTFGWTRPIRLPINC
jgi:DNA repair protein SbcD/Mre11